MTCHGLVVALVLSACGGGSDGDLVADAALNLSPPGSSSQSEESASNSDMTSGIELPLREQSRGSRYGLGSDDQPSSPSSAPSPTPAPSPAPAPVPSPLPAGTYPIEQRMSSQPVDRIGAMPGYLSSTSFEDLGTRVMRITDSSLGSGRIFRHAYAMRQPWNADGSRLLLVRSPIQLLDGRTYEPIGSFSLPSDAVWSNTDPDVLFGVIENGFVRVKVSTRTRTTLRTFSEYSRIYIGGGEGNVSDDDRRVALIGVRSGGVDVLVYDIERNTVVSTRRFDGYSGPHGDIDSAAISPSGRYVLLGVDEPLGYDLYDAQDMKFLRRLVNNQRSHSDMGYTMEGHEALITSANKRSAINSIRLADGVLREEAPSSYMAWNQHTSCRNNLRPGWCYISTFSHSASRDAYMYRQIFAIKLDGSGTVQRFAPGTFADNPADQAYLREAHAVPSRDGRRVLFASDWRDASAGAPIHTYVVGTSVP